MLTNLSEKFQITALEKKETVESWKDLNSARVLNPEEKFNEMPPGYQCAGPMDHFTESPAGATDVTNDVNDASTRKGYAVKQMKATDDQYTGEHADQFYGDAGGFVERNNLLDRM